MFLAIEHGLSTVIYGSMKHAAPVAGIDNGKGKVIPLQARCGPEGR
jgi:hypothetical protein